MWTRLRRQAGPVQRTALSWPAVPHTERVSIMLAQLCLAHPADYTWSVLYVVNLICLPFFMSLLYVMIFIPNCLESGDIYYIIFLEYKRVFKTHAHNKYNQGRVRDGVITRCNIIIFKIHILYSKAQWVQLINYIVSGVKAENACLRQN